MANFVLPKTDSRTDEQAMEVDRVYLRLAAAQAGEFSFTARGGRDVYFIEDSFTTAAERGRHANHTFTNGVTVRAAMEGVASNGITIRFLRDQAIQRDYAQGQKVGFDITNNNRDILVYFHASGAIQGVTTATIQDLLAAAAAHDEIGDIVTFAGNGATNLENADLRQILGGRDDVTGADVTITDEGENLYVFDEGIEISKFFVTPENTLELSFGTTSDPTMIDPTALTIQNADTAKFRFGDLGAELTLADFSDLAMAASTANPYIVAPTSSVPTANPPKNVVITDDDSHKFHKDNFGFEDDDTADSLHSITITSLPDQGTLELDGTVLTVDTVGSDGVTVEGNLDTLGTILTANIPKLFYRQPAPEAGMTAPATGTLAADAEVTFTYTVSDGTNDSAPATLTIEANKSPAFTSETTGLRISETTGLRIRGDGGDIVGINNPFGDVDNYAVYYHAMATDPDGDAFTYSMPTGGTQQAEKNSVQFTITADGVVFLRSHTSVVVTGDYPIIVIATDSHGEATRLTVNLQGVAASKILGIFDETDNTADIVEQVPGNPTEEIAKVIIGEYDNSRLKLEKVAITYSLDTVSTGLGFVINPATGSISYTGMGLNFEDGATRTLVVTGVKTADETKEISYGVIVTVINLDNSDPVIDVDNITTGADVSVADLTGTGTTATATAKTADGTADALITWSTTASERVLTITGQVQIDDTNAIGRGDSGQFRTMADDAAFLTAHGLKATDQWWVYGGEYGTLVLKADGTYSYVLDATDAETMALTAPTDIPASVADSTDGDDTIDLSTLSVAGGEWVILGQGGNDTITLGAGTEDVVYRLAVDTAGDITNPDGGDTVGGFTRGTDRITFVDTAGDAPASVDDLMGHFASVSLVFSEDVGGGTPGYTGIEFGIIADDATTMDVDESTTLRINFAAALTADGLAGALGTTIADAAALDTIFADRDVDGTTEMGAPTTAGTYALNAAGVALIDELFGTDKISITDSLPSTLTDTTENGAAAEESYLLNLIDANGDDYLASLHVPIYFAGKIPHPSEGIEIQTLTKASEADSFHVFAIDENTTPSGALFTIPVTDADNPSEGTLTETITYTLDEAINAAGEDISGDFVVSQTTGAVSLATGAVFTFNHEENAYLRFSITASSTSTLPTDPEDTNSRRGAQTLTIEAVLLINDVNEDPTFATPRITASPLPTGIEVPVHQAVYVPEIIDEDQDGMITYGLRDDITGDNAALFDIDPTTGAVTFKTATTPVMATQATYTFTVTADDAAAGSLTAQQAVTINVGAANTGLRIGTGDLSIDIAENGDGSTTPVAITQIAVTRGDSANTAVTYALDATSTAAGFAIANTGAITYTGAGFDYETEAEREHTLIVTASSGSDKISYVVTVSVTDIDDNDPVFNTAGITTHSDLSAAGTSDVPSDVTITGADAAALYYAIDENETPSGALFTIPAADADAGDMIVYTLTATDAAGADVISDFAIDADTGEVSLASGAELDHEASAYVLFGVTATSTSTLAGTRGAQSASQQVILIINDVGEDLAFTPDSITTGTIPEDTDGSTNPITIGTVEAIDPDADAVNVDVTYTLDPDAVGNKFVIDPTTGEITYAGPAIDFETAAVKTFTLTVTATAGTETETHTVQVTVTDEKEPTVFGETPTTASIVENQDGSTTAIPVITITATDPAGGAVTYALAVDPASANADFAIGPGGDGTSGAITYTGTGLDRGTQATYTLTITATFGGKTEMHVVTLTVAGANNNDPTATPETGLTVDEEAPHTFTEANFGFDDDDGGAVFASVTIVSLPVSGTPASPTGALLLNGAAVEAGAVIMANDIPNLVYRPANALATYTASFTYTVSDGERSSANATMNIEVTADNDAPDPDIDDSITFDGGIFGFTRRQLDAGDPDTPASGVTYTLTAVFTSTDSADTDAAMQTRASDTDPWANLAQDGTFTQADVDNGHVRLNAASGGTLSLQVSDGPETNPPNPAPVTITFTTRTIQELEATTEIGGAGTNGEIDLSADTATQPKTLTTGIGDTTIKLGAGNDKVDAGLGDDVIDLSAGGTGTGGEDTVIYRFATDSDGNTIAWSGGDAITGFTPDEDELLLSHIDGGDTAFIDGLETGGFVATLTTAYMGSGNRDSIASYNVTGVEIHFNQAVVLPGGVLGGSILSITFNAPIPWATFNSTWFSDGGFDSDTLLFTADAAGKAALTGILGLRGPGADIPVEALRSVAIGDGEANAIDLSGGNGASVAGREWVVFGGGGDDMITLGAGTEEVVYRLAVADADNAITAPDGGDTVGEFTRGTDSLTFVDTAGTPPAATPAPDEASAVDVLMGAFGSVSLVYNMTDSTYTGVVFGVLADTDPAPETDNSVNLTVSFATALTADALATALGDDVQDAAALPGIFEGGNVPTADGNAALNATGLALIDDLFGADNISVVDSLPPELV